MIAALLEPHRNNQRHARFRAGRASRHDRQRNRRSLHDLARSSQWHDGALGRHIEQWRFELGVEPTHLQIAGRTYLRMLSSERGDGRKQPHRRDVAQLDCRRARYVCRDQRGWRENIRRGAETRRRAMETASLPNGRRRHNLCGKREAVTVWRRENTAYACIEGEAEEPLATPGFQPIIIQNNRELFYLWENGNQIMSRAGRAAPVRFAANAMFAAGCAFLMAPSSFLKESARERKRCLPIFTISTPKIQVPEPATASLLLFGAASAFVRSRGDC